MGDDIRAVEEANAQINETNGRALALLESLTGEKLGAEPAAWQKWWAEQLGLSFNDRYADSKPTFTDAVEEPDIPVYAQVTNVTFVRVSCFAAGTMVQTMDGPRKIESIAVGDRVLSQHTLTGAFRFNPYWPPPCAAVQKRFASASTARQLSQPASTASGKPALAGRWLAS